MLGDQRLELARSARRAGRSARSASIRSSSALEPQLLEPRDLGLREGSKARSARAGPRHSSSASRSWSAAVAASPASASGDPRRAAPRSGRRRARPAPPAARTHRARSGAGRRRRSPSARRICETAFWSALGAVGGGAAPHSASTIRSLDEQLVAMDQQQREQRPLARTGHADRCRPVGQLQRTEDAVVHAGSRRRYQRLEHAGMDLHDRPVISLAPRP